MKTPKCPECLDAVTEWDDEGQATVCKDCRGTKAWVSKNCKFATLSPIQKEDAALETWIRERLRWLSADQLQRIKAVIETNPPGGFEEPLEDPSPAAPSPASPPEGWHEQTGRLSYP